MRENVEKVMTMKKKTNRSSENIYIRFMCIVRRKEKRGERKKKRELTILGNLRRCEDGRGSARKR